MKGFPLAHRPVKLSLNAINTLKHHSKRPNTTSLDVAGSGGDCGVGRHGGPDAEADVRVRYLPDAVEVEIVNSGRPALTSQSGLGLLGMRERAVASGGSIEISPRREGGFRVRLTVPRPEAVSA